MSLNLTKNVVQSLIIFSYNSYFVIKQHYICFVCIAHTKFKYGSKTCRLRKFLYPIRTISLLGFLSCYILSKYAVILTNLLLLGQIFLVAKALYISFANNWQIAALCNHYTRHCHILGQVASFRLNTLSNYTNVALVFMIMITFEVNHYAPKIVESYNNLFFNYRGFFIFPWTST